MTEPRATSPPSSGPGADRVAPTAVSLDAPVAGAEARFPKAAETADLGLQVRPHAEQADAPPAHGPSERLLGGAPPVWSFDAQAAADALTQIRSTLTVAVPATPPPRTETSLARLGVDDADPTPPIGVSEGEIRQVDDVPYHDDEHHARRLLGPSGKRRRPLAVVAFTIATLGVYALLWYRKVNREMADFDRTMNVRPAKSLAAVALPVLATFVLAAAGAVRLAGPSLGWRVGIIPLHGSWTYLALIAPVAAAYLCLAVPFTAVSLVMTLERIRVVQDRVGLYPDIQIRPTRSICWLLMPVFGGLALMAREQSALNAAWDCRRQMLAVRGY